ncbi:MAG TPA: tetratricopeptide repeat protein [Dehalococcoidia bacterium]|nr:tetratricopeptide repeat protein [Dehalococcoidia bacterium]
MRRQRAEQAIQLALESRWKEAAALNRSLISMFPSDVDAYNRLGKASMEMGKYDDARMAYQRALELEPLNTIARKNLERLEVRVKAAAAAQGEGTRKMDPSLFIADTGKTGMAPLRAVAPEALGRLTAGDTVELRPQDNTLAVVTPNGEYVGRLEPKLGLRLLRLMDGGNRYVAAVASLSEQRVMIREIYQHPSQQGRPSFPATGGQPVRPYVKDRLVRRGLEDEEAAPEEAEEGDEWAGEKVATEGDMTLQDYQEATEGEDDAEEGFEE